MSEAVKDKPSTIIIRESDHKGSTGDGLKNVAIATGVVAAVAIIYKVSNVFGKGDGEKKSEAQIKDAIDKIVVDTSQIDANMIKYTTAAESLYNEMSVHVPVYGSLYSFDKIRSLLDGMNTEELKQIVKTFGARPGRIFNLVEAGGGGSIFDWFDDTLNEDEREIMRQYFVFTALDKMPTKGMDGYFTYDDEGIFDSEHPNRKTARQWTVFTKTTSVRPVYPIFGNVQSVFFIYQDANGTWQKGNIKPKGYGAIGKFVGYDAPRVNSRGHLESIQVEFTDTRLGTWYGKRVWINSRVLNQTAAPKTSTYPL